MLTFGDNQNAGDAIKCGCCGEIVLGEFFTIGALKI